MSKLLIVLFVSLVKRIRFCIIRLIILVERLIDILKFAATANGLLHNRVVFNGIVVLVHSF